MRRLRGGYDPTEVFGGSSKVNDPACLTMDGFGSQDVLARHGYIKYVT